MPRNISYRDLGKFTVSFQSTINVNGTGFPLPANSTQQANGSDIYNANLVDSSLSSDLPIQVNNSLSYPNSIQVLISQSTFTLGFSDMYIFTRDSDLVITFPAGSDLLNSVGRLLYIVSQTNNAITSSTSNINHPDGTGPNNSITSGTGKWVLLMCDGTNWDILQAN